MTITWYGHSCFKILNSGGQLTIIIDPFKKGLGLNPPRSAADIVLVTHNHPNHNNIQTIAGQPFVINSPGEYEIKGVKIIGLSGFHDNKLGQEKGKNTIYLIEIDKIQLCHLGDLGQENLTDEQIEAIGSVDVLMLPVGGADALGAKEALKVSEQLEPKIIIPMHYKLPGLKVNLAGLDNFLKEIGIEKKTALDKLTLKKKDLTGKEMEVVVMKI